MNKKCLGLIALSFLLAASARASGKIDPYLDSSGSTAFPIAKAADLIPDNIPVFIKTTDTDAVKIFIKNGGGKIHSAIDDIITADTSQNMILSLSERPEVVYIEASRNLALNLDQSRAMIGAAEVQLGHVNDTPYTGRGVIVGIIDTGIDWSHGAFQNEGGESRIISIWDQGINSSAGFTAPGEIENSYGIECDNSQINDGSCPSIDTAGHGTHVAGIAASSHEQYKGIAPGAELIIVKAMTRSAPGEYTPSLGEVNSFTTHVIDAANYIFTKANALGKPAVINMSLGMQFGAHDGTSIFENALDAMLSGSTGRSIVVSVGNNNNQSENYFAGIHAGTTLSNETKAVEFHGLASHVHGLILDIWQPSDSNVTFGIGVDNYDGYENTGFIESGSVFDKITDDGKLRVVVDSSETNNPLNGKKHTLINITAAQGNEGSDVSTADYVFDLIASGSGSFDAWIVAGGGLFAKRSGVYEATGHTYFAGDSRRSIGIPSTAKNVISTTSYASRSDLAFMGYSVLGDNFEFTEVGEISPFSSFGPTVDPEQTGQKPEIAAPGEWIISAFSGQAINTAIDEKIPYDLYGIDFAAMRGTSMAAPHVAGAVALLFERNPALSFNDVKYLLEKNVDSDERTGVLPNNRWGYGRLSILKAMQNFDSTDLATPLPWAADEIEEIAFTPSVSGEADSSAQNEGGGGCSIGGSAVGNIMWYLLLPIFAVFVLSSKRMLSSATLLGIMFLCACGSSGGGASPLSPSGNVGYENKGVEINSEAMMAVYTSFSDDGTEVVQIGIPLKHFFPGEDIEIGVNNLLEMDGDQAIFTLARYRVETETVDGLCPGVCETNHVITEAWISVGGRLRLEQASVSQGSQIVGRIEGARLRSIDLSTQTMDRDGEEVSYEGNFEAAVSSGTDEPIITEMYPVAVVYGGKITVKGFNLYGDVHFMNCGSDLPFETVSENQIEVTINAYCDNARLSIDNGKGRTDGYAVSIDGLLEVSETPMPVTGTVLSKAVMNRASNSIYFLFEDADELYLYSIDQGQFAEPLRLPEQADTFDVSADGTYIAVASGSRIHLMDNTGGDSGTIVVPDGGEVGDLSFGPGHVGLVSAHGRTGLLMGTFDADAGTVTFSDGMKLSNENVSSVKWYLSPDRRIILVYGDVSFSGQMLRAYPFSDDITPVRGASAWISYVTRVTFNASSEEIWFDGSIYDYNLNKINEYDLYELDKKMVFTPDGRQLITITFDSVNVYDSSADNIVMSGIPYPGDVFELPTGVFITDDGADLIFFSRNNVWQVNYGNLAGWINAE